MRNLVELHLKPATLERYGLPDVPYSVPAADLQSALLGDRGLPLAVMLHGLQLRSGDGAAQWLQIEPAMNRLAELLAPDDTRESVSAAGDTWWLEIGPVDLGSKLVTIQRGDVLVAAITARDDGRLRVAVFRPLDAKSAEYLIGLGQVPHPEHGVCMRENNWEYALDSSAGNGNYYAADRGEAYLSYWEKGLGVSSDGTEVPEWRKQKDLVALPAARVATELGIYYTLSGDEGEQPVAETGEAAEPETSALPAWRSKRQQRRTVQGRFLGCLLGGAVGDALGAPVEFMSRTRFSVASARTASELRAGLRWPGRHHRRHANDPVHRRGADPGLGTRLLQGITTYSGVTAHAYLRWLQTQGERIDCARLRDR